MNNKTLLKIKRSHTVEEIITCYNYARDIGVNSINMDIILGLPGEKVADFTYTIQKIKELKPDNLTAHTLAIKTGSEYKDMYKQESGNEINKMIKITSIAAVEMKMDPYYLYRQKNSLGNFENVGYATKGKFCAYNISIMEEKETIIGVGMGAVSKIYDKKLGRLYRLPNYRNLNDYKNKLDIQVSNKNEKIEKIEEITRR